MSGTICNIVGTLKDSKGTPLSGKLVVKLDSPLRDNTTTPDSLHLDVPAEFIITNGVVNINLIESETSQLTYFFQFYLSNDTVSLFDFHAEVPNVASYEFASLAQETGISTSNLTTGALRVAREILINPSLAPLIFVGAQLFKLEATPPVGTAFDGAIWIKPSTRQSFIFQSSRNKWKSNPETVVISQRNLSATTNLFTQIPFINNHSEVVLDSLQLRYLVRSTPNDTTNRWGIQCGIRTPNSDSIVNVGSQYLTNGQTVGQVITQNIPLDTLYSSTAIDEIALVATRNGSPGNINVSLTAQVSYLVPA